MQVIATFHPFDASNLAVAAPTPLLPPVIIATGFDDLLLIFNSFSYFLLTNSLVLSSLLTNPGSFLKVSSTHLSALFSSKSGSQGIP